MQKPHALDEIKKQLHERRVPCMVAFLHPFRIVEAKDKKPWQSSLQEVNTRSWDYVALHEVIGGVDVGLPAPYHMLVCRDGGVAIPPIPELRGEKEAVAFFNKCFASLVLGGVYCEAIGVDGLDFGSVIDWKFVRVHSASLSATNRFHSLIRLKQASAFEAIALESPRTLTFELLERALLKGRSILESIPELGGEIFLRGITSYARRDWSAALANLWISIEQITSHIWKRDVIEPARKNKVVSGRVKQLSDYRTWTISARHELLLQIGSIDSRTFSTVSLARKARNTLAHEGRSPDEKAAEAVLASVRELLLAATKRSDIEFLNMNLSDHTLSDPFEPRKMEMLEPKYWMPIPKLPNEEELEKLEASLRNLQKK
ncbi:MAG: hypothetical protein KJ017_01240 [Alphaproteobacteria bacterium]|nr:hypothetical protein [Alphaproteobacteria bacterium]